MASCCLWLCFAGAMIFDASGGPAAQAEDSCIACHKQKDADRIVAIHQTSTHGRASIGCDGCHGGDSSQTEKARAHAQRFVGKPDSTATLQMCGKCHQKPLEFFRNSRHFAARPNVKRLDCAECHGVHGIGAASESFRWPLFCAGCHGLEYLPQLPRPFQEMLALADDLGDGLHRLEAKGRAPDAEMIRRRKEIRRLISELVHQTDARGGAERIPRILELGSDLKNRIASEEKK